MKGFELRKETALYKNKCINIIIIIIIKNNVFYVSFYKAIHFNLDNLYSCVTLALCLVNNFILALFIFL